MSNEAERPPIGASIRVTLDCMSDARNEGMGILCYANRGETLIVRGHSPYSKQTIYVSHPHITDSDFSVDAGEYEVIGITGAEG